MVGRIVLRWSLIAVALLGARTVAAAPITFTGNVAADFNSQTNPGVMIITDTAHENLLDPVAQPAYMTASGLVSGMNIKDLRLDYDAQTDTMYVGVQTWGVAGNVDGNGTPGVLNPQFAKLGGSDPADWADAAGHKSMVVGFGALTGTFSSSSPVFNTSLVAGISANLNQLGPGVDGLNVAKYVAPGGSGSASQSTLASFGTTLTAGMLNPMFVQPSQTWQGFEFAITNFSKISGINPANGMIVTVQDGSISPLTGKDNLFGTTPEAQQIPEPTTWMVWAGMAGGLAWARYRRSRRTRS
jgi:hypothetical protein